MNRSRDLACRQLVELITDYLEDALGPADLARVEEHLAKCDGCEAYLTQLRLTIALSGGRFNGQPDGVSSAMLLELLHEFTLP